MDFTPCPTGHLRIAERVKPNASTDTKELLVLKVRTNLAQLVVALELPFGAYEMVLQAGEYHDVWSVRVLHAFHQTDVVIDVAIRQ